MSTGIATDEDIILAVDTCKKVGNGDITLLNVHLLILLQLSWPIYIPW